jgi:putative transposase
MRYRRVIAPGATFFFTLVTEQRRPLLREPEAVALLLAAVDKVRSRHPFEVDAYVILPDHLHAIWTLPEGDANFSTRWRLIKEAFTRAYIKAHGMLDRSESRLAKGEQAVWQRRFWEHAIRDETDFARHVDYRSNMGWPPQRVIGRTHHLSIGSRAATTTNGGDLTRCQSSPNGSGRSSRCDRAGCPFARNPTPRAIVVGSREAARPNLRRPRITGTAPGPGAPRRPPWSRTSRRVRRCWDRCLDSAAGHRPGPAS